MTRLAEWGRKRRETWSQYLQFMLETLRSIVRLDPDRALSHRLRERIRERDADPWHLVAADGPRVPVLRPMNAPLCRPRWSVPMPGRPNPKRRHVLRQVEPEWTRVSSLLVTDWQTETRR